MGIEALIGALVDDGRAEAEQIRAAAGEEAARLLAEVQQQAEAQVEAARAGAEAELRTHVAEALFAARRESRRTILAERERVLEDIRSRARRIVEEAHRDPRLPPLIARLTRNAASYLPDGAGIARAHPLAIDAVRDALAGQREIECRADAQVAPGVVVEDAEQRLRVEETLPVRLDRLWPTLRMTVTRAIEGSP